MFQEAGDGNQSIDPGSAAQCGSAILVLIALGTLTEKTGQKL
jgi:hypothetical protein